MSKASVLSRALLIILLMVPIFISFGYFLTANAVETVALRSETVVKALSENDAYERIYTELLLDDELKDVIDRLKGGFDLSDQEAKGLLLEVLPPHHVQAATERSVVSLVGYLNYDSDDLDVYIDLGTALDAIWPAIRMLIDQRIDALPPAPARGGGIIPQLRAFLRELSTGSLPTAIPSLEDGDEAARVFEKALDTVLANGSLPSTSAASIRARRADISAALAGGGIKDAVKVAAAAAAAPMVERVIADLRTDLDAGDRLDLVHRLSIEMGSREAVLDRADMIRFWLRAATGLGPWLALLIMAVCTLSIGVACLPYRHYAVSWPSVSLVIVGLPYLVFGWLMTLEFSRWAFMECGEVQSRSCRLAIDVSNSLATEVGGDVIAASAVVVVIGMGGVIISRLMNAHWGRS